MKKTLQEFKEFISRGNVMDMAVGVIIGSAFTSSFGDAHFRYGAFLNSVINFLIIAFVVFLLVKFVNKLMPSHDEAPADPEPSAEEKYLAEIVELLKDKQK